MSPDPSRRARALWRYVGDERPAFAASPGPGQESVWDYPRPPRLVADTREVVIRLDGVEVARSSHALRILETASPPTFYLPLADCAPDVLVSTPGSSYCEWKGVARYWSLVVGVRRLDAVAWSYPDAVSPYEAIRTCFSVYPGRVPCFVDGERVRPQEGGFYGGWVTDEIVGPWKGEAGTSGW